MLPCKLQQLTLHTTTARCPIHQTRPQNSQIPKDLSHHLVSYKTRTFTDSKPVIVHIRIRSMVLLALNYLFAYAVPVGE